MTIIAAAFHITEHGHVSTALGRALRVTIERTDGAPMGFRELYAAYADRYPGRWALQTLPPAARLFDGANRYHLHVIDEEPVGLDLFGAAVPVA